MGIVFAPRIDIAAPLILNIMDVQARHCRYHSYGRQPTKHPCHCQWSSTPHGNQFCAALSRYQQQRW